MENFRIKTIRVAELFAGVGGFRLGLEGWNGKSASSNYKSPFNSIFKTVWSNQWEPGSKIQHASNIYTLRFGPADHSNTDISQVRTDEIPDFDMLVGGFPCQDYSVARQLSQASGIEGKKGVLWWQIRRIIEEKGTRHPNYVFLENVDRLINSPSSQRGRDFAIILASLSDLGFIVEWRVINAADYGMPQRRRRTFILAYHKDAPISRKVNDPINWLTNNGIFAKEFPIKYDMGLNYPFTILGNLVEITENFNKKGSSSPFYNSGIMMNRQVWTIKTKPNYDGHRVTLGDILEPIDNIENDYFLNGDIFKWEYLKGAKKEPRKRADGEIFFYNEGPLPFPDPIDRPARTIITSEGGKTASRFKHVVMQEGRLRRLTPIELEKANMFPPEHTLEANPTKRAFLMGNALVVGVIEKIGKGLMNALNET